MGCLPWTARCLGRQFQSGPRTSPPAGVMADHQVVPLMPCETKRTLPSARLTLMPAVCGELATLPSPHPPLAVAPFAPPFCMHPIFGLLPNPPQPAELP